MLVHGTWASNAAWSLPDSLLSTTLTSRLSGGVTIVRFRWSGRNSYSARRVAGQRLGEMVEQLGTRHARAAIFIIAHSHGGNVARYALERGALQQRVRGLITLATPFLEAKARLYYPLVWLAVHGVLFPAAIYLLSTHVLPLVYRGFDFAHTFRGLQETIVWLAVGIGGFVLGSLVAGFYLTTTMALTERIAEGLAPIQDELLSSLAAAEGVRTPMMVMAFRGDEAGLWLRLLQSVTAPLELITKGIALALFLATLAVNVALAIDILLEVAAVFGLGEAGGLGLYGPSAAPSAWNFVWNAYIATLIVYLLGVTGFVLLPRIVRGHGLGFGREPLAAVLLVRIRARVFPRHEGRVTEIRYGLVSALREALKGPKSLWSVLRPGWIHSLLSCSPLALEAIAGWIEGKQT